MTAVQAGAAHWAGVFDLFTIGIGPSSSHTVGPMRAARRFVMTLAAAVGLDDVATVQVELFGSLAATGPGHGTPQALILGLEGQEPETVDPDEAPAQLARIRERGRLRLAGGRVIRFTEPDNVALNRKRRLERHSNAMRFVAFNAAGGLLLERTYCSIGGGAVVEEGESTPDHSSVILPYPFDSAAALLAHAQSAGVPISRVMLANETTARSETEVRDGLLRIWAAMRACVEHGCAREGRLPGVLGVERRAPALMRSLQSRTDHDPLHAMDWVSLFALAVNEENAAGGRVVTAPTNGAAGILPAVLHYYDRFVPGADDDGVVKFLLTAGAIGTLYKRNASISGAEVGCQGEVGSACSMAAGGLAEVLGGTPQQVEQAAEIGMEHNLGLTCDPIGGLVQIPSIERNALAAVKAITAARLALRGDGSHHVSLDDVIKTMRATGADMSEKYKETALGGLAVNVTEC
jgi:L-serine dehydratase